MGEIVLSICVGLCLVIIGFQVLYVVKRDEKKIQELLINEREEA